MKPETQTQTQTQIQNQNSIQVLEKAVEFLKNQLSQEGVAINMPTPLREEWQLLVYKIKNNIEYLIMRKAKEYEEKDEEDPLRKAKEDILKKILKAKEMAVMIEKEFKEYPIKFELNIDVDNNKMYVCITLNRYVDKRIFNEFVNLSRKIGLVYIKGMNCREI